MASYILRRLAASAAIIIAVSFIAFVAIYQIGDPVALLVSEEATPAERLAIAEKWGTSQPFFEQYGIFVERTLRGDFGSSFVYAEPVAGVIFSRLPATLELAFSALILIAAIGVPLGLVAGMRPRSLVARIANPLSLVALSLPSFWVGIMLIFFGAVKLGLLPAAGRGETASLLGLQFSILTLDGLRHVFLPALNLALPNAALVYRLVRASVMEAKTSDYVRFARAKGLPQRRITGLHVFRNILVPLVTVLGLELGSLIAFAVITESIFAWPGVGKLIIDSINMLDRPIVVAYLMLVVTIIVFINLVVDLICAKLDPRLRIAS